MKNYIKEYFNSIMVGFVIGYVTFHILTLIDDVIVKIALIHAK